MNEILNSLQRPFLDRILSLNYGHSGVLFCAVLILVYDCVASIDVVTVNVNFAVDKHVPNDCVAVDVNEAHRPLGIGGLAASVPFHLLFSHLNRLRRIYDSNKLVTSRFARG